MQLTAVFETWHIPDGNYPPLSKGQFVNLSFEVQPETLSVESVEDGHFAQIQDAEYRFTGKVLKVYSKGDSDRIVVIQAGSFRFYINSFPPQAPFPKEGEYCEGVGRLLLDHYIWVEYLDSYADAPDLFYTLQVARIRCIKVPERFIHRHDKGASGPTSVAPEAYSTEVISEVQEMSADDNAWLFYLVDLVSVGAQTPTIPLTFRSHTTSVPIDPTTLPK